jgi:hypothetical protein
MDEPKGEMAKVFEAMSAGKPPPGAAADAAEEEEAGGAGAGTEEETPSEAEVAVAERMESLVEEVEAGSGSVASVGAGKLPLPLDVAEGGTAESAPQSPLSDMDTARDGAHLPPPPLPVPPPTEMGTGPMEEAGLQL